MVAYDDEDAKTLVNAALYRTFYDDTDTAYTRPQLAASLPEQKDADGKVWTIALRPDLKWSDGTPITADTFVYSYKMAGDPKLAQRAEGLWGSIVILNFREYYFQTTEAPVRWEDVGIKAVDDHTLEITLTEPSTQELVVKQLKNNAASPVDPDLFEACMSADRTSNSYGTEVDKMKYCGAFVMTEWVKESFIKYEKNPNYVFADEVKLDGVEHYFVENYATRVEMFEASQLDSTPIAGQIAGEYLDNPDMFTKLSRYIQYIDIYDGTAYYVAGENRGDIVRVDVPKSEMAQPVLSNMNFKNALWYAVDRTTLAGLLSGVPMTTLVPYTAKLGETDILYRDTKWAQEVTPSIEESYNPELAREYLEKALKEEGLEKVTLKFLCNATDLGITTGTFLQETFLKIFDGKLELVLEPVPETSRLATQRSWSSSKNQYELALSNWASSSNDKNPIFVLKQFTTAYNPTKTCNSYHCETAERIIWEQDTNPEILTNMEYNAQKTAEIEKALIEERVVIPMFETGSFTLRREYVINNSENQDHWMPILYDIDLDLKAEILGKK